MPDVRCLVLLLHGYKLAGVREQPGLLNWTGGVVPQSERDVDVDTLHMKPDPEMTQRVAKRGQECPYRRVHSCGLIDTDLGWMDGIDMETCDACWKSTPSSWDSTQIREEHRLRTIDTVKANGIEKYAPIVQVSIMGRFMGATEREDAKRRIDSHKALVESRKEASVWDGVPYPKRVLESTREAYRAFRGKLKSYQGCGCIKPLKRLVRKVI